MTSTADVVQTTVVAGDGVRLAVSSRSPAAGSRAMVVVVHGWGEHGGRYVELARALVAKGFSVWTFDLRGHGLSGGRKGHARRFSALIDDLGRVVHAARESDGPGRPWFLLGHSLGGLIVLRSLQTGAVAPRGACVSAPWLRTAHPIPGWKRGLALILNHLLPSLPIPNPLDPSALTHDQEKILERGNDPLVHGWMTSRLFLEVEAAQLEALQEENRLDLPLLVFVPCEDPVVDPATTDHFVRRGGGSGARIIEVPKSRHEPFNEVDRKDRFDEVAGFFNEVLE